MAREKAKQTFRIQGRRRRAASSVASLGYGLHPERAHQESNPLVPELFISTSLNDPPGWYQRVIGNAVSMSAKNKAFLPPLLASCICSALSKLESTLDSKCTVHYELSEEFTARIAVNTFTSVSVLAIWLAWFQIRLKKEAGLDLLTEPALLQLYYSRKHVYTLLSKWGYVEVNKLSESFCVNAPVAEMLSLRHPNETITNHLRYSMMSIRQQYLEKALQSTPRSVICERATEYGHCSFASSESALRMVILHWADGGRGF
ncbi:hypothetical protein Tsp_01251 [Trichinella spiralis]|uniref:hypothetical protein n=1 Tax=Trichinella spiralis TaxID=6334 RepID=UPI0001EFCA57|nr:hypothetical protein Tsp_01251 [Trichinella spiralis]